MPNLATLLVYTRWNENPRESTEGGVIIPHVIMSFSKTKKQRLFAQSFKQVKTTHLSYSCINFILTGDEKNILLFLFSTFSAAF